MYICWYNHNIEQYACKTYQFGREIFHVFCSIYNKTIIRFGFCDIQNNQGLAKGYNLYLDLDYSGYQKNLIQ